MSESGTVTLPEGEHSASSHRRPVPLRASSRLMATESSMTSTSISNTSTPPTTSESGINLECRCANSGNVGQGDEISPSPQQSEHWLTALRTVPATTNLRITQEATANQQPRRSRSLPTPRSRSSSVTSGMSSFPSDFPVGSQRPGVSESEEYFSFPEYPDILISVPRRASGQVWSAEPDLPITSRSRRHQLVGDAYSEDDNNSDLDSVETSIPVAAVTPVQRRGNSISDCSECSNYSDDDFEAPSRLTSWLYPVSP